MTKRQENAKLTRQKLIETGTKLIKEKGLASVSIEEITKIAGVAKGTFYIYFKHKEDILTEICLNDFKQIEIGLKKMKKSDIAERLTVYFDKFMYEVEKYGVNICREWIRDNINPLTSKDGKKWGYDVEMLTNILNDAVKNNELKDDTPIELLVHIIISELYGMMTCWCMSDTKFEPKEWTKKFCEFQLNVILEKYISKKGE